MEVHSSRHHHLLSPLLDAFLLLQLLSDVGAERHLTVRIEAMLRVIATQGDQLLADRARSLLTLLALFCMADDSLHLMAAETTTVCISALTRVHKTLNTALDALISSVLLVLIATGSTRVTDQACDLLHLVLMLDLLVARIAQIVILENIQS